MTTAAKPLIGASSKVANWEAINWRTIEQQVKRLQMRIAKATRERRWGKVKSLQWLLTHAFSAKLLAVRRVTRNSGRKTPGVDGIVWKTPAQKLNAARSLQRQGYCPKPLRRIYTRQPSFGTGHRVSPVPSRQCHGSLLATLPVVQAVSC
jgi:RNA-directed DNA polymerase